MEFFGMGPVEILVILIVGLIAFGPGKIPQLARSLGRGIASLKKMTREITEEVSKELEDAEKKEAEPRRLQAEEKHGPDTTER